MVVKGRWVISGEMLLRVLGGGEGEEVIGGFQFQNKGDCNDIGGSYFFVM